MVVDGEFPPSKRRRTERRDNPPADDTIAQSNAHLQFLTGGRQNRWMQRDGQEEAQQAAVDIPLVVKRPATNNTARSSLGRTSASPAPSPSLQAAPSIRQEPPRVPRATSLQVVQYDSPSSINTPIAASIRTTNVPVNGRKSLDVSAASQQGLPSPAPSEENSNSPTTENRPLPQHQRARPSITHLRPSSEMVGTPSSRPTLSASPLGTHPPAHAFQQVQPQQFVPNAQLQYPVPLPSQYFNPFQAQGPVAPQMQPGHQPRRSVSASLQTSPLRIPPSVPSNYYQQQQPQPQALQASRLPPEVLLKRLNDMEAELIQSGALSAFDKGRIELLRDAVQRSDWFYQVLSQMFCLRTLSPSTLPESMSNVNNRCYDYVSTLLCANTAINPRLVDFFAKFPEDIMRIYSSSVETRDVFEARLQSVKAFLNHLAIQWEPLVAECKARPSPPLVQDMVERLKLQSVVLQTTIFRAITRMVCGSTDQDMKVAKVYEMLHTIDQDRFMRHQWKRNAQEKQQAHKQMKQVYVNWIQHVQRHQQHEMQVGDFPPPQDIVDFFSRPPPNKARELQQLQNLQQLQQLQQFQQFQQMNHVPVGLQERWHQAQSPGGSAQQSPVLALQQLLRRPGPIIAPPQVPQAGPRGPRPRRFFPHPAEVPRPQPTQPNPNLSSLHQAHVRSPQLAPATLSKDRLYRHVVGFAMPPMKFKKTVPAQKITFEIAQSTVSRLAKIVPSEKIGEPGHRSLTEESLVLRLRCSVVPTGGFTSEHTWVTADNVWPEGLYFELNGKKLETRRKLHNGRYLAIDLTAHAKEGANILGVFNERVHPGKKLNDYALAVEVIGVKSHETISKNVNRIAAEQSLSSIMKSLAGEDGDDEIAVTSSSMTIKLFDPYSGCKIFDVPVRGSACLHKDCFDLETFLNMCKREKEDWPTVVDCWRCPLCRGDVRPQTLVLDEFLVKVREELAQRGLLETRAIIVEPDGSWKPKAEEMTGVRSPSLEREEGAGNALEQALRALNTPATALPPPKKVIEVIELD